MIRNQPYNIYIASCDKNGGIYHYHISDDNLSFVSFSPMDRPMYMVSSDSKMYVLLRAPFSENNHSGLVVYDINKDGDLINPSETVSTKGEVACHLCVECGNVYCTNYISGSIIKINSHLVRHIGKGVNAERQESAHPHFVGVTPDKKHICVADLGLDTVFLYDGELNFISKARVPSGHGARHLAFSDNKLYCINELNSTLSVFKYSDGNLEYKNTVSVLPSDFYGDSAASAIRIKDNLCYIANRGHNSFSVLDISYDLPKLITTVPCGGDYPRDFNIIGDTLVCANEKSNNVTFFKIENGIPKKMDVELNVKSAFCISFLNLLTYIDITRVRLSRHEGQKTRRRCHPCFNQRSHNGIWNIYRQHAKSDGRSRIISKKAISFRNLGLILPLLFNLQE